MRKVAVYGGGGVRGDCWALQRPPNLGLDSMTGGSGRFISNMGGRRM